VKDQIVSVRPDKNKNYLEIFKRLIDVLNAMRIYTVKIDYAMP
jgi:hypothetical protein